ncbi:MAG TPA: hypothetical protein DF712_23270, partial [Balneola sp.]|nr:hypothetical protein [Balneola sp.]
MALDQFYTKPEVAKLCCDLMDFSKYESVLEPSAGTGAFLDFLPSEKTNALDIDPKREDIEEGDFLKY